MDLLMELTILVKASPRVNLKDAQNSKDSDSRNYQSYDR